MKISFRCSFVCRHLYAFIIIFIYSGNGYAFKHSHEGAPLPYDQWQLSNGIVAVECPENWSCDASSAEDGFLQRSLTDSNGHKYIQTIVTDVETRGIKFPHELAFVNESFISVGHGRIKPKKTVSKIKKSEWDGRTGIAFSQAFNEVDSDDGSAFISVVRGTSGVLFDPENQFFISQLVTSPVAVESDYFESLFILDRGFHEGECCNNKGNKNVAGHNNAPGHENGHDNANKNNRSDKNNTHYAELVTISQSLVSDDMDQFFYYQRHQHNSKENGKKTTFSTEYSPGKYIDDRIKKFSYDENTNHFVLTDNNKGIPAPPGEKNSNSLDGVKYLNINSSQIVNGNEILNYYTAIENLDPFENASQIKGDYFSLAGSSLLVEAYPTFVDPFL